MVETYLPFLAGALDVMQLLFVGFAIFWTLRGWRADLVDDRRVLRWFIIGVQGALIFSVVFVENFLLRRRLCEQRLRAGRHRIRDCLANADHAGRRDAL